MSVFTTQGYKFRLVAGSGSYADRTQLDLFADEEIKVSNNITDLFDIGAVPGTFTRTLTLPGTKRNNRFFEQYYDISVDEPDLFSTNQKVEAYIDFDGIYLVNGYLQLQKVSVYENKFVDSYEVNIFGLVSNFTTDAQTYFLTDLDNLAVYNHTSSLSNISASWQGNLFSGSIRYALTDSGTGIYYSLNKDFLGIDDAEGALTVQQFKPAIKVKTVWDACFDKLGYTYTSSFFEEPMFDNMYMILNNNLKYPVYPNLELEKYCQFKVTNITGSNQNIALSNGTYRGFPVNSAEYDYNGVTTLGSTLQINIPKASRLTATINLVFAISSSTSPAGSGMPAFYLEYQNANDLSNINTQVLANINSYLETLRLSRPQTVAETFELPMDFTIPYLPKDTPVNIRIKYEVQGTNNFTVTLNPSSAKTGCSLTVKALNQGADFEVLDVPFNMPYGVNGIKILDFVRGIQKKFNLVMYEDKQIPNQFKVETFNTWYKLGQYKDFNQYINLDEKIEFIPATTLAVNKLSFTDTQDNDFVSTVWQRTYNRTFGQAILIDTGSYFSQGEFNVKTTLAAGPLTSVPGAVFTGSYTTGFSCLTYLAQNYDKNNAWYLNYTTCDGTPVSYLMPKFSSIEICSSTTPIPQSYRNVVITQTGNCTPALIANSGSQFPMFIPYYIADTINNPARVLPRLFFYNGQLPATPYNIQGYLNDTGSVLNYTYYSYPYFDNYSVVSGSALPTTGSYSLLYNNETPSLGTAPSASLINTYWETYLNLLYNPKTRLVNAAAVIPLADYFDMELNDLVQFRSNYYHLRAINDYNLTTGQCAIQLLGPIIPDTVKNVLFPYEKYDIELLLVGGGGGGGGAFGGGGGGGNVAGDILYKVTEDTSYEVVVGQGGLGEVIYWGPGYSTLVSGSNGGNSTFGPLITNQPIGYGGGRGGGEEFYYVGNGNANIYGQFIGNGGGGGGFESNPGIASGSGTFNGGQQTASFGIGPDGDFYYQLLAGGGGGASEQGGVGSRLNFVYSSSTYPSTNIWFTKSGNGGSGSIFNTFTSSYFGGGGGGGGFLFWGQTNPPALVWYSGSVVYQGSGSLGGGGRGGMYYPSQSALTFLAQSGSPNSGGGGGGGGYLAGGETPSQSVIPNFAIPYVSGAPGGSGIVMLRYSGSQRGTGGTVTTSGSYTYHTFTGSGYFRA